MTDAVMQQLEMMKLLEPAVQEKLVLLRPVAECWQPDDFLPDCSGEDWIERLTEFRDQAQGTPDELLVVLIGNTITEEALPSYQTWLNRVQGVTDETGTDMAPWAQWSRGWTAEENRHGDILNQFLYLSGRVDMRCVQATIQHLIRSGFNPEVGTDPYQSLMYVSFQERATKISHANVAGQARRGGQENLAKMCGVVAGDEARHEEAYKYFAREIFVRDPEGALIAFEALMRTKVTMPAKQMDDGECDDIFGQFTRVAQSTTVYTVSDYTSIIEHLLKQWSVPDWTGLGPEGAEAQEYLCKLAPQMRRIAERVETRMVKQPKRPFAWIYGRSA